MLPADVPRRYGNVWQQQRRSGTRSKPARATCIDWDAESTYIQEPPFLVDLPPEPGPIQPIRGARVLAVLGDSVTTDHISPAGSISQDSPAGKFLVEHGVQPADFNSYGAAAATTA